MADIVQKIAIMFPTLLLALVIHEYAHAWMAQRFGDKTALWSDRLTLNPAAHIDPLGTVVFPLIGIAMGGFIFGWARPVPINPSQFKDYRKGLFWVAFAGPLSNIILGFIAAFIFAIFVYTVPDTFTLHKPLFTMLQFFIQINFVLAIFNLLPLPPLDGSKMLESKLSYDNIRKFEALGQYSFFILIFLLFSGAFRVILYPVTILTHIAITLAINVVGVVS